MNVGLSLAKTRYLGINLLFDWGMRFHTQLSQVLILTTRLTGLSQEELLLLLKQQLLHELLVLMESHGRGLRPVDFSLKFFLLRQVCEQLDGSVWTTIAKGPLRCVPFRPCPTVADVLAIIFQDRDRCLPDRLAQLLHDTQLRSQVGWSLVESRHSVLIFD